MNGRWKIASCAQQEWRGFTVPTEENSPAGRAARWAALGEPEDPGDDLFTDESGVSSDADDAWVTTAPEPAALTPHAPPVFPVWGLLTEAQETAQLAQLRQWVLFAVQRYEIGAKIRPCWAQHGPAVESPDRVAPALV